MPDLNPFDMGLDEAVNGPDCVGFDYLAQHAVRWGENVQYSEESDWRNTADLRDDYDSSEDYYR
jgi:hypothetical protein